MLKGTQSLVANTPATLNFNEPAAIALLSNDGSAKVYGKVNWLSGDGEPSATDFHFVIPAGGNLKLDLNPLPAKLMDNLRLMSTANAVVGFLAE